MTATPVALVALGVTFTVHGLAAADADRFRHLWASCLTETPPADPVAVTVTRTASGWRAEAAGLVTDLAGDDAALAAACSAVNLTATSRTPLIASHAAVLTRAATPSSSPGLRRGQDHAHPRAAPSRLGLRQRRGLRRRPGERRRAALRPSARRRRLDRGPLRARRPRRTVRRRDLPLRDRRRRHLRPVADPRRRRSCCSPVRGSPRRSGPCTGWTGLEELLRRCFTVHADPVSTLRVLAAVTRGAEVVRLAGDDPEAAAEALDAHLC